MSSAKPEFGTSDWIAWADDRERKTAAEVLWWAAANGPGCLTDGISCHTDGPVFCVCCQSASDLRAKAAEIEGA